MGDAGWRRLLRPVAARLVQAVLVAVLVGAAGFALMHALPGDQAFRLAAERYGPDAMDAASAAALRTELGLDQPLPARLAEWLWRVARLDLGRSLVSGAPVAEELRVQLGHTLLLAGAALLLSALLGPPLGLFAGMQAGGAVDRLALGAWALLRAVPAYALGLGLILVLSIWLGWLPPGGFEGPAELALPALTLALGLAALSGPVARDAAATVAASPYVAFARWKGLPERAVALRHGARNAAVPVVALLGAQLAWLVEGVVVVESLFGWPGIGHALAHAVFARDVPVVQGAALAMGLLFVASNTVADVACAALDPRRERRGA